MDESESTWWKHVRNWGSVDEPKTLKVGDRVVWCRDETVVREITAVRNTGYSWIYPGQPDEEFISENSNDQFFQFGWRVDHSSFVVTDLPAEIVGCKHYD